jgi:hypothetical protein
MFIPMNVLAVGIGLTLNIEPGLVYSTIHQMIESN